MNGETKPALSSLGIVGPLVSVLVLGAQLLGVNLGDPSGFTEMVVALIGSAVGIWGRVRATKRIAGVVNTPLR